MNGAPTMRVVACGGAELLRHQARFPQALFVDHRRMTLHNTAPSALGRTRLAIARRLHLEHLRVLAAQRYQLLVGSFFDKTAARKYYDAVGHAHR